jgi:hypothetical protein
MSPDVPDRDENQDTVQPVPPYEGRRESADVDPQEKSAREGVKTGGATGPVEDPDMKGSQGSERGPAASPTDEQPAAESGGEAPDEGSATGPAHETGTRRGEDMRGEDSD